MNAFQFGALLREKLAAGPLTAEKPLDKPMNLSEAFDRDGATFMSGGMAPYNSWKKHMGPRYQLAEQRMYENASDFRGNMNQLLRDRNARNQSTFEMPKPPSWMQGKPLPQPPAASPPRGTRSWAR